MVPNREDIIIDVFNKKRMTRTERCREGDSEERANPAATAALSVRPGANQDNPLVLDEAADTHEDAAPNAGKPSLEVADLVERCDPYPTLLGVLTELGTNDGKNAQNSLARYPMDSRGEDEEERAGDLHENEVSHNDNVAWGESGGNGMVSNTPASISRLHNVFAESEKTCGMARWKPKVTCSAPHDYKDSVMAAGSIPQPIRLEEPRAVTDDGVAIMEQPTEVTGDDIGSSKFSIGLENRFMS